MMSTKNDDRAGAVGALVGVGLILGAFGCWGVAIWTHSADTAHRLGGFGALLFFPGLVIFAFSLFLMDD